jgi:sulfite reductase (ferredoxin)
MNMKFSIITVALMAITTDSAGAFSFTAPPVATGPVGVSSSRLSMVLEKPRTAKKAKVKKISKLEILKTESDNLLHPLKEELQTESIGISKDAYQIMKYHGSYQQSDREKRGKPKDYQFMLRLKQPAGELPPDLYRLLDDLSANHGQGDLRATTRHASRCTES